ncbi:MAG: alpha amylase C-terminal domain-containing protein [Clostridia bacterium]|nr:alpha amylase C-terminal domain-containing protein [Clostridia bacterium]
MATECASHTHCEAKNNPSFVLDESILARHAKLGVTRKDEGKLSVYTFRVWAPRADSVHLVGEFVGWEKGRPMTALAHGVWEYHLTTEMPLEGMKYKYKLFSRDRSFYHADPYAWQSEATEHAASAVCTETRFRFQDDVWMKHRQNNASIPLSSRPIHVYEIHAASWRTHNSRPSDEAFAVLGYRELADALTPYVKGLAYTHVAFSEDMIEGLSYMAPPARHGSFDDFLYFVNKLHANGVGVLYPFPVIDIRKQVSDSICSYRCPNLTAYIVLTLLHFAEKCHVDGFLSQNEPTDEAKALTAFTAQEVKKKHPDLIFLHKGADLAANDAFDLQSGNKEDSLWRYFACDPFFRRYHQASLAVEKQSLLCEPDGKGRTLMSNFFGNYEEKFATMRLYHIFRLMYPAALLSVMGNELAPFTSRTNERELEWFLLDFSMHRRYFNFVKEANTLYLENPPLFTGDCKVLYENASDNVLVLSRRDENQNRLTCVFNCSAVLLSDYFLPIDIGDCHEIFSTDSIAFGGSGQENTRKTLAENGGVVLDIPPLSAVILKSLSNL